ncbi:unnamed protein product [Acanthoscelides obtectus]|uniref:Uncharacterized protein n=1 Tax=Acanthoscelides obtectus TaxID=200917 RepID=A0A9P0L1F9_ACAOB|nr:unnamed protein product [Acanthoscelides obtectus]CAK1644037.1 hypothetical protein AOBTE_LOCUS13790 [Acanthoscelides obtectus]
MCHLIFFHLFFTSSYKNVFFIDSLPLVTPLYHGHSFRVGFTTVSAIVTEVYEAICRYMEHIYLPEPTENIWKKCAEEFI